MPTPKPAPAQAESKSATPSQRRSLINRIVQRLVGKLKRKSVDQLERLTDSPSLTLVPRAKPTERLPQDANQFAPPPTRPVGRQSTPLMRIAIVNHKGGVGKTSTAINLSAALAEMNYRVLVFDCDSQGDLS